MPGANAAFVSQPLSYCAIAALLALVALLVSSIERQDMPESESERRAIACEHSGKSMEECAYIEMQRMLVK